MGSKQQNIYVVEVDMKNKSVEDIARAAALQIIGIMDELMEWQKEAKELKKELISGLSQKQRETIKRIQGEPESIIPKEE